MFNGSVSIRSRNILRAVGAAEHLVGDPLGMGHQAQHIARLVEDAGDVAREPLGLLVRGLAVLAQ